MCFVSRGTLFDGITRTGEWVVTYSHLTVNKKNFLPDSCSASTRLEKGFWLMRVRGRRHNAGLGTTLG